MKAEKEGILVKLSHVFDSGLRSGCFDVDGALNVIMVKREDLTPENQERFEFLDKELELQQTLPANCRSAALN